MQEMDQLKQAVGAKRRESLVMSQAYSTTLGALAPANFVLVVGAALLSLIAGASILIENDVLTKTQSGVLALVSGAFTIIHSKLACEQYQAECKKLRSFYRGIADEYANLQVINNVDQLRERFSALNDQFSGTIKTGSAFPFDWATTKARKGVEPR